MAAALDAVTLRTDTETVPVLRKCPHGRTFVCSVTIHTSRFMRNSERQRRARTHIDEYLSGFCDSFLRLPEAGNRMSSIEHTLTHTHHSILATNAARRLHDDDAGDAHKPHLSENPIAVTCIHGMVHVPSRSFVVVSEAVVYENANAVFRLPRSIRWCIVCI